MDNITQKYRPRKFSQIVGQMPAVSKVVSNLKAGVIPPAYIAYGLQGCGKTSIATIIAMSLNCENREGVDPCGECESCTAILEDRYEMFMQLDAATNSGVADMRNLMSSIKFVVPENTYRVVVIDECQSLTKQSWEATLKTIERPPPRVLFVFCTTQYQSVPNTVKSRCVQLQFSGVIEDTIIKHLKAVLASENVPYDDEALTLIARYSNGSIRDSQSILEGFIHTGKVESQSVKSTYHTIDPNTILSYFNALGNRKLKEASNLAGGWIRLGCAPLDIVNHLLEYLSNMIMDWNIKDKGLKALVKTQRESLGEYRISCWIQELLEYATHIRNFPSSYTILVNNLTIRLASHIFSEYEDKKDRRAKKAEKTKATKKNGEEITGGETTNPQVTIDSSKIPQFEMACGVRAIRFSQDKQLVEVRHKKNGLDLDIVTHPDIGKNAYYVMYSDLDRAITAQSLQGLVHKRQ